MRWGRYITIVSIAFFAGTIGSWAENWPQWRGPYGNGCTTEAAGWHETGWGLTGPDWQAEVGRGASSPVVMNGRVYVMGWREGQDYLFCLDAATGAEFWTGSYSCPPYGRFAVADQDFYRGPSSTPTYDAQTNRLYSLSADGDLICWEAEDGQIAWRCNLHEVAQTQQRPSSGGGIRDYGYTTAPLVYANWVIVEAGGSDGNLVAFDKVNGKVLWRSENTDPPGHSGGLVRLDVDDIPCVATLTLHQVVITRLDQAQAGQTLCAYPWATDYANNIPTPVVVEAGLLITSGFNHSQLVRLQVTTEGCKPVWESSQYSGVCSPVVSGNQVYFVRQEVWCLDLTTGQLLWSGGDFGDDASCIITGEGKLLVWGKSQLALVETAERSPTAYQELGRFPDIGQRYSWPHLALAEGRIYVKDSLGNLYSFLTGA